ncbi:hypothetical protein JCGZ_08593 [Jatropha curcas]|uniref:Uncharacterized protein n=1 Tax=Jatropha curcas TaxID=180498 RepID=A0A067KN69_JATCU|nr:hypothetical protein JCGZ_08593 [Jatropha curcas]
MWDKAITAMLKKLCADRYADFTYRMRRSAAHTSTASAGPQPEHIAEQFTELRVRVDDQQRQIAELRAHVMRLSDDTLVTPPGATSHPAGTPPGDPTSDRADEQPHRFDFGPF